jgi:hypothetical protein
MPFTLNTNEFLSTLTNLCLQVLTFDNIQFTSPFDIFRRRYTTFGDKIASVNAFVQNGRDYGAETNPYNARKPDVKETTITTTLKKMYDVQLNLDLLKGAFEDEGALGLFLSTLISQLNVKSEIDIYEKVVSDFASGTGYKEANNITGSIDTADNVKALYSKIMSRVDEFDLPNTTYSADTNDTTHYRASMNTRKVLILTPQAKAQFDVYVNASLFNSSTIALDKKFAKVIVADIDLPSDATKTDVFGIVLTEDVYRYSPRIERMVKMPTNGATLSDDYWYHVWTNTGFTGAGQISYITN